MKLYPNVTLFFITWFFVILAVSYFGFLTLPHSGNFNNDYFRSFSNWDGGHFLGIAELGYSEKFQYAFFPLYPLLIRIINGAVHNFFWSAILISVVSSFLGMQFFYRLMVLECDKKIAEKAILLLLIFPTSFYFMTVYSEGLFFLLTILTFYFLKQKKLFWATIFAAFSSAARLHGLAVVLALLFDVLLTRGLNKRNWYVLLSPLGFLIYCFYLFQQTADPLYFFQSQLHWQRNLTVPAISFWETIRSLSNAGFINEHIDSFIDLIFAIFGLGLGIRTFRFLPISYSVYAAASVLLPLFTPTLSSIQRFLLPIFPIFILLALTKNKYLSFGYKFISVMMLSIFVERFINGYWVS